ncbi:MarC family protein [Burkholderia mallei]|uniref:MarC family protein n=1 Tax=Burkholderia mallei TaxID=13373 RepID=UPI0023AF97D8|nr:MarC family protein [Burkholderia mallei]
MIAGRRRSGGARWSRISCRRRCSSFSCTDPLGNIPLVIAALRDVPRERRVKVILREVAIAFVILLFFMVVGDRFLRMMSLPPIFHCGSAAGSCCS